MLIRVLLRCDRSETRQKVSGEPSGPVVRKVLRDFRAWSSDVEVVTWPFVLRDYRGPGGVRSGSAIACSATTDYMNRLAAF